MLPGPTAAQSETMTLDRFVLGFALLTITSGKIRVE